jgi:hypothetical protein
MSRITGGDWLKADELTANKMKRKAQIDLLKSFTNEV